MFINNISLFFYQMEDSKIIIGLIEHLIILKGNKRFPVEARIDSGATKSSIDINLAKEFNASIIDSKIVKSAHGVKRRPIVALDIELAGKKIFKAEFSIVDRNHMKYRALIGQNILKKGFLIDPSKVKC